MEIVKNKASNKKSERWSNGTRGKNLEYRLSGSKWEWRKLGSGGCTTICFTAIKSSTPHTFSKLASLILDGTLQIVKLLLAALLEVIARISKRS